MLLIAFLFSLQNINAQKVKVACLGNSVTWGYALPNREEECYPKQLSNLLGEGYDVQNFGVSGATLLKKGHKPYFEQPQYKAALEFTPDIVVISLGLNDTDPRNWPNYSSDFIPNYLELIDSFRKANAKAKIFICRITPIFSWHSRFKSGTRDWYWKIQESIAAAAKGSGCELIDLYTPLHNRPDLFKDALHPDKEGAQIIAQTVYGYLSKRWGGLKLGTPFSNHMVLQRNKEIPIWGSADAGDTIEVAFNKIRVNAVASSSGRWSIKLPEQKAGGPYRLEVSTSSKKLVLNDILIGEVWICSGQSNMQFPLKLAKGAENELPAASNSNIRLLNLRPIAETGSFTWSDSTRMQVNRLDYLRGGWSVCTSETAKEFSAIAYYFGKKLSSELNVPIGLVLNAVGGSPIESWIGRYELEHSTGSVDLFTGWSENDLVQPWVRERAKQNMGSTLYPMQRHPYQPAYLFEASVEQLIPMAVCGIIWYQGESNAHNPEFYSTLFPLWVDCWRSRWNENLPIGFVQLSSLNRPSWPAFRDVQRRLSTIRPNLGMVVSSDLGDSLDVHPTRKREVGERLADWALSDCYHMLRRGKSPTLNKVEINGDLVSIQFYNAKQLKSSDGKPLREFEVAGEDRLFSKAAAIIKGRCVWLKSDSVKHPVYVRYAWTPYSTANLENESGYPVSTFTTEY